MKRVAVIGTQGLPAAYGGFETLVENLVGENCPPDVEYTVFCSTPECPSGAPDRPTSYKGARLRYVPLRSHGVQSIPYDILQMMEAAAGDYDVLLVLGTSGCSFLPLLRRMIGRRRRLIVNIDGLEHRREKWGSAARKLLLYSERQAVKYADVVIADNDGIADYVRETYRREPAVIAYGGDHALRNITEDQRRDVLGRFGVNGVPYAVTVCRIEPENNCHLTLQAFARDARMPILFIGNWDKSEYGRQLKARFAAVPGIRIIDPIYDPDTLCALRSSATLYVHGHSAGGTNPSLVEAMFAGCPIACFDVVYNRATTFNRAYYFNDEESLRRLLCRTDLDGSPMAALAREHYTWAKIARQYTGLF